MFAKRPQLASGPAVSSETDRSRARDLLAGGRAVDLGPLANPVLGAAGAGFLLLLTAIGTIAVVGDPAAGAPRVHISLASAAVDALPAAPQPTRGCSPCASLCSTVRRTPRP